MAEIKLAAEPRTEFGKGAARRIRRDNKIPAVLYGHGTDPVHVTLPGHESMLALRQTNVLLSIELDGKGQLAVAKDIQRDPVRNVIEHNDLQVVRAGEKITVDIPVNIVGESAPGTIHLVEAQKLSVEAEATHIPEYIEVSIEGINVGDQILAKDLTLPSGSTVLLDDEHLIVNVTHAPTAEELEEELAEAEAEAGIEREESEEEAAEGEAAEGEGAEGATAEGEEKSGDE